uniref:Uncharacterized LOC113474362 n=1 Tax=Ciona intestinalis TaxID=7719 RepID=H2XQP7_CIOIN|nr:uncharacterized protein LOC113474362 [Ciona intestinalis]|eukprot:XP_026690871.1 uncharacterized protein LOC113474362 [Ciona intestinalis]
MANANRNTMSASISTSNERPEGDNDSVVVYEEAAHVPVEHGMSNVVHEGNNSVGQGLGNVRQWQVPAPYQYHVGIFSNNEEVARRVHNKVVLLGYRSCIYEYWLYPNGEPLPEKSLAFIKDCMLIFWIASPGGDIGYMNHAKNVAHHDCITTRPHRSLIVVIPEEHLRTPETEIVPGELQAYGTMEEDNRFNGRVTITVKHALRKLANAIRPQ